MNADLARSDLQRGQLTADITHDLSTPLQVIAGYIEMLENNEVTLTPQRIQIIMNEIELLRQLVSELSLLSTADEKELQMQMEPVDPADLLIQIINAYAAIAKKENKEIRSQVGPKSRNSSSEKVGLGWPLQRPW